MIRPAIVDAIRESIQDSVGTLSSGGGSSITTVFEALSENETDKYIYDVKTGIGSAEVVRSTPLYVPDEEGIFREVAANKQGIIHLRKVKNYCASSEDFDKAVWGNTGITVTPNAKTDPFGGNNGTKLVAAAGVSGRLTQGTLPEYLVNTMKIVNLTTGALENTIVGAFDQIGATAADANGWRRWVFKKDNVVFSIYLAPGEWEYVGIQLYKTDFYIYPTATGTALNNGDGISGIYTYGAQVENSLGRTVNDVPYKYTKTNKPIEGALDLFDPDAYLTGTGSWQTYGTNTVTTIPGENGVYHTYVDTGTGARLFLNDASDCTQDLVVGKDYLLTGQAKVNAGVVSLKWKEGTTFVDISSTSYVDFEYQFTAVTTTGEYFNSAGMGAGEIIYIKDVVLKEVVSDTQYLTTENGSSVAANVLTEADGADITANWGLRTEQARTNEQIYSSDLTNAEWTSINVTRNSNADGLTGEPNTGSTLTASAGSPRTVIANAITAASDTHATQWHIRRKTGTGTVELTVDNGTTWQDITSDLTTSYTSIAVDQAAVTNPQVGIRIGTSGDAVEVGNVGVYLSTTKEEILLASPIFTTSAPIATGDQKVSWDAANHDSTVDTAYLFDYEQSNLTPVGSEAILGTADTDTILLLNSDNADGSVDIVDTSPLALTAAVGGNTHHDTAQKKFGASSIYFDGASDSLGFTDTVFNASNDDWTIECWYRPTSKLTAYPVIWEYGVAYTGGEFYLSDRHDSFPTKFVAGFKGGTGLDIIGTTTVVNGTWYHLSVERYNGYITLRVNGVAEGTPYNIGTTNVGDGSFMVGMQHQITPATAINGHIDSFRVIKGTAIRQGDFTPPVGPYSVGTLSQVDMATMDASSNLTAVANDTVDATKALSSGMNKTGIYIEGGKIGAVVGGTGGTEDTTTGKFGGNLALQVTGVRNPMTLRNIKRVTGSGFKNYLETETT